MPLPSLPNAESLRTLRAEDQRAVLDALFEPSQAIHSLFIPTLESMTFASYDALIDQCHGQMVRLLADPSPDHSLHSILSSHPRLGAKKVDSAQSSAEQAQLNSGGDGAELAELNAQYEERFPGLRYVVFVNGRGRPEIMDDMRKRIERGDFSMEEREGVKACCRRGLRLTQT